MQNLGEKLEVEEIQARNFLSSWKGSLIRIIQTMIDSADLDGDGQINYEEFYTMMKSVWGYIEDEKVHLECCHLVTNRI